MNNKKLTLLQIGDRIQYWYSKYYNCIMRNEKEIYENLYKAYEKLEDYYKKHYYK